MEQSIYYLLFISSVQNVFTSPIDSRFIEKAGEKWLVTTK